jgi:hypothetical protein
VPRSAFLGAFFLLACSSGASEPTPFDDGRGAALGDGTLVERLAYPDPPFGSTAGAVIANYRFLGWSNPASAKFDTTHLEPHSLAEFYDPNGAKGLRYLIITSTAVWCSACKLEYRDMATNVAAYQKRGAEFMGALFEDNDSKPAQPSDLANWGKQYAVEFPFVLDPELKFGAFFDVQATPMVMIVDTRKMEIVNINEGWASEGPGSVWTFLDQQLPK